jgi:long-chain acyl-CoA synthetase
MPTRDEVQAMLTGPGGPFEVETDTVNGVEMKVYKSRMMSLREVAAMGAGRGDDPARPFLVYGAERMGFASFVGAANSVSSVLAEACGVGRGDRVAVLAANCPEWCLACWGVVDMGAVLVGLNGWWKTDEILYGLRDSGSRVLVVDRPRFERIADSLDSLPDLEAVYLIGDGGGGRGGGVDHPKVRPFSELLRVESAPLPDGPIEEDDPAVIFYTSGTTGRPKGAVSTHRSMIANLQNTIYNAVAGAMAGGGVFDASGATQTTSLLTSPLFHVSGCHSGLVVGLAAGVKLVIPVGKFEPEKAMRLIEDERVTVWATVPTMVWRVVEHPDRASFDLTSVTSVAYGGSPSAGELQRRVQETFVNVRTLGNAYGLTESSSVATVNSGADFLERPDSVGRPLPVVDVRIVDASGADQDAPVGSVGEVWIKGPIVMPGYWNKPSETAAVLTPDGWLKSGDIGFVDADGFVYITDRAKDMIIRGGENVYCVEIENRLAEHPAVAEAAVIGVPHPTLGEEVKAVVRLDGEAVPSAEAAASAGVSASADVSASSAAAVGVSVAELQRFVGETLADFKVPAYIEFTAEPLPRNASGKLLKNVLRGEGEVSFAETM